MFDAQNRKGVSGRRQGLLWSFDELAVSRKQTCSLTHRSKDSFELLFSPLSDPFHSIDSGYWCCFFSWGLLAIHLSLVLTFWGYGRLDACSDAVEFRPCVGSKLQTLQGLRANSHMRTDAVTKERKGCFGLCVGDLSLPWHSSLMWDMQTRCQCMRSHMLTHVYICMCTRMTVCTHVCSLVCLLVCSHVCWHVCSQIRLTKVNLIYIVLYILVLMLKNKLDWSQLYFYTCTWTCEWAYEWTCEWTCARTCAHTCVHTTRHTCTSSRPYDWTREVAQNMRRSETCAMSFRSTLRL